MEPVVAFSYRNKEAIYEEEEETYKALENPTYTFNPKLSNEYQDLLDPTEQPDSENQESDETAEQSKLQRTEV